MISRRYNLKNLDLHKIPLEAQDWLVACLDPYHDSQLRLEGLPDMVSAPSIVKLHNQSYTLTAPASAVGDWDATIAFTGVNSEIGQLPNLVTQGAGNDYVSVFSNALLSTACPFGTFVVKAGAATNSLTWGAPVTANDTHVALGASEVSPDGDRCRIIAVAFEITNTTATIYQQGSLTVAALPNAVSDYSTITFKDTGASPWSGVQQSMHTAKFAASRSALIGIPGASVWPAKDGAYVIPRMVTHTMPVENPSKNKRVAVVQDSLSDTVYHLSTPDGSDTISSTPYARCKGISPCGFAPVQVFLNGLSHESSLTITFRTIVEYFPSFNSALLPLTTPSPAFSPKAFEIYSRACQLAPYAVPVDQNSAGEYFRKVLAFVAQAASLVAPISGSFAPIVSTAGATMGAVSEYLKKREEDKMRKRIQIIRTPKVQKREAGARAMPAKK